MPLYTRNCRDEAIKSVGKAYKSLKDQNYDREAKKLSGSNKYIQIILADWNIE